MTKVPAADTVPTPAESPAAEGRATRRRTPFVLGSALLGISASGPLVRLSHAEPLAIASWRLGFSLIIIAFALVLTGEWRQWRGLEGQDVRLAAGAGASLACHFWSWNTSVAMTSVSASVVLVNTQPIIVALLSALWLKEAPTRRQWTGIAIALLGALVVASADFTAAGVSSPHAMRALAGDLLALVGGVTAALYFVIGRRLRAILDLWAYVGLVYGTCFVVLLFLAVVTRTPLALRSSSDLGIFAALALGPMLLGHTGVNWALKQSRAYVVNVVLLGEPVGATIIAALVPGIHEIPGVATIAGGTIILFGILLTARS